MTRSWIKVKVWHAGLGHRPLFAVNKDWSKTQLEWLIRVDRVQKA